MGLWLILQNDTFCAVYFVVGALCLMLLIEFLHEELDCFLCFLAVTFLYLSFFSCYLIKLQFAGHQSEFCYVENAAISATVLLLHVYFFGLSRKPIYTLELGCLTSSMDSTFETLSVKSKMGLSE